MLYTVYFLFWKVYRFTSRSFINHALYKMSYISCCRFNDYGNDGGPAAKTLEPRYKVFSSHVLSNTGFELPEVEMKNLVAVGLAMKGVGGLLFIMGSSLGAYLLLLYQAVSTPILHDFYNYDVDKKEFAVLFVKFTQSLALFGALLFFIGMKNSMPRRQLKRKAPKTKTT